MGYQDCKIELEVVESRNLGIGRQIVRSRHKNLVKPHHNLKSLGSRWDFQEGCKNCPRMAQRYTLGHKSSEVDFGERRTVEVNKTPEVVGTTVESREAADMSP